MLLPLFIFFTSIAVQAQNATSVCNTIVLESPIDPGLSEFEKRLLCGDPDSIDPTAWKTIPLSQAEFVVKNFLQGRGYLRPEFRREDPVLYVKPGTLSRVKGLSASGQPASFDLSRKRKIIGEILTPSLLSNLEKWATQVLKRNGYACPQVKAVANSTTDEITLQISAGSLENLTAVFEPTSIPGIENGVLRRNDAFEVGALYNDDEISLTENRITNEGTVQSAHFITACSPQGATLTQEVVVGAPRLLTVGAGIDTEGLILAKVSWKNARLGRLGSIFQVNASASSKTQEVNTEYDWYVFHPPSRFYLDPGAEILHDNEDPYEIVAARAQFFGARSWDYPGIGIRAHVGPALDQYRTLRGLGPASTRFLSLELGGALETHEHELNRSNPREGSSIGLTTDFNSADYLSEVSAQRLTLQGQTLINIRGYDPPLLIIGVRGGATTIISGSQPGPNSQLPESYFQYLGGSQDIRGFGLKELPTSQIGGMTSVFVDSEFRLSSVLPLNIEPLLFFDWGFIGETPLSYNPPIYYSPGFGIRYASPIGTFRTTLAHGYPSDVPGHFQFYLSFGQEF